MTQEKQPRTRWSPEENARLALPLLVADPRLRIVDALRRVQDTVLPAERRRSLPNLGSVPTELRMALEQRRNAALGQAEMVSAEEVQREESPAAEGHVADSPAKAVTLAPVVDPLGNTKVKDVQKRTGKNARGEWTLYIVKFEDGREGTTFSASVGIHAQNAQKSGALVHPEIVDGEKDGNVTHTLKELGPIAKAPEPSAPDEPVAGPEKILTVREAKTPMGSRWVIQTSKRQVIATEEVLATQAVEARKANVGMVPIFKVVAGDKGALFNCLTNWQSVEGREPGSDDE